MRLSLRTLLAFEDNIFDTEQHRQLERAIPVHDAAAMTLGRIRKVVRNPRLGVPGLTDDREELDPNIVAEYLDHQMPEDVQERFEAFCLSSDKYLAEVASIHQVLSNVLGEPARTSRDCRLRCYDLFGIRMELPTFEEKSFEEKLQYFAEHGSVRQRESDRDVPRQDQKFDDFLRLFPDKEVTDRYTEKTVVAPSSVSETGTDKTPEERSTPRSTFGTILRYFFSAEDTDEKETPPKTEPKNEKRGFSLWMLLLVFLLGFGTLFGWRLLNEDFEIPREYRGSKAIAKYFEHPLREITVSETPPAPPLQKTVTASMEIPRNGNGPPDVLPPPKKEEPPKIAVKEPEKMPKKQAEDQPIPPAPAPMVMAPKKEELPQIAVKEPEKQTEAQPVPKSPAPMVTAPKKEELPKIVVKEPEKQSEKQAEAKPVPPPPTPVVPAPKKEELPKIAEKEPEKVPEKQAEIVTGQPVPPPIAPVPKEKILPKTAAQKEVSPPKVDAQPVAAAPVVPAAPSPKDPFLNVVTKTNSTDAVQPVSWNHTLGQVTEKTADERTPFKNVSKNSPELQGPMAMAREKQEESRPSAKETKVAVPRMIPLEPSPLTEPASPATVPPKVLETPPMALPVDTPARNSQDFEVPRPLLVSQPVSDLPEKESLITFQPITAAPQRRSREIATESESQVFPHGSHQGPNRDRETVSRNVHGNWTQENSSNKTMRYEPVSVAESPATYGKVVHPIATARQFGVVTPVGQLREKDPRVIGRVLPLPEPCVIFSAPSAGEQWSLQSLPLDLYAEQYLLTVTPYRVDVDLGGVLRIEMVGDAKMCLLPPDESGIPGIFVDYGRLVIRPNPSAAEETPRQLRIQTEHAEGILRLTGRDNVAFIDTFAEALPENGLPGKTPKTSPIIALLPATGQSIQWHPSDRSEPLTAYQQASVPLKPETPGFGTIQSLPNWLQRTPLPVEGRQLAEICARIFKEQAGNCEAALQALILQENPSVRFFGYRLWGDLGRFDVPLALLAEMKPEEEPVRQVLVPYFREVMKRDEETIQRFADAIETVRR